jgi:hypothetical protein
MRRFDNGLTQNIGEAAYRGVGLVVGAVKREGDRGKRRKTRGRRIQRSESSAYADDGAQGDPKPRFGSGPQAREAWTREDERLSPAAVSAKPRPDFCAAR